MMICRLDAAAATATAAAHINLLWSFHLFMGLLTRLTAHHLETLFFLDFFRFVRNFYSPLIVFDDENLRSIFIPMFSLIEILVLLLNKMH